MDKQRFLKTAVKCLKSKEMAAETACFMAALDRDAVGIGDGAALVWRDAYGTRRIFFTQGVNRDAEPKSGASDLFAEELFDDESSGGEFSDEAACGAGPDGEAPPDEDSEEGYAADYRAGCTRFGSRVDLFFHANRRGDGITVKEDFASMGDGLGNNPREIPIVYWNSGKAPVKVEGTAVQPGQLHVVFPDDPRRKARRELREEQNQCLAQFIASCYDGKIQMIQKHIMELEPRRATGKQNAPFVKNRRSPL